jgi:hypothetical protein
MRILKPVVSFVELFPNPLDISLHISVTQLLALLEIVSNEAGVKQQFFRGDEP